MVVLCLHMACNGGLRHTECGGHVHLIKPFGKAGCVACFSEASYSAEIGCNNLGMHN